MRTDHQELLPGSLGELKGLSVELPQSASVLCKSVPEGVGEGDNFRITFSWENLDILIYKIDR